ncbi:MAG: 16S rRNA (cytosine(1402)-N(4))-methyltransferase RsmH [Alphaproteobacteria bacterium]
MMAGGGALTNDVAGGPARHIPVLLDAVMSHATPIAGETFIDATFGAGGYSRALLDAGASVVAIDRDPHAIAEGQGLVGEAGGHLALVEGRYSELDRIASRLGHERVDGVVLDAGVSSMQLDRAERGFSFSRKGPLDMRMEAAGPSAADVVNGLERQALARVIAVLGEEKRARAVAAAIERARAIEPVTNTYQLAEIVSGAIGRPGRDRIHPATRTFQALRIFVNRELGELADALAASERILGEGGRLVVVAFHSLEDRIVKRFMVDRSATGGGGSRHRPDVEVQPPSFERLTRDAVVADDDEIARNPRARSARLRAARRTSGPARPSDLRALGVPVLDDLSPVRQ